MHARQRASQTRKWSAEGMVIPATASDINGSTPYSFCALMGYVQHFQQALPAAQARPNTREITPLVGRQDGSLPSHIMQMQWLIARPYPSPNPESKKAIPRPMSGSGAQE
jgi:hypothetical protein